MKVLRSPDFFLVHNTITRNSCGKIMRLKFWFQADWYFAKLECKVKGMELVSIESEEEQNVLVQIIG